MARPGCRRPRVRNGTDPQGLAAQEEEPEHAGCRQPADQRGGLLVRARLPQAAQQARPRRSGRRGGRGRRPGWPARRPARPRPPPAGCPAAWPRRPGRRGGRGRPDPGPAARRPARARPPPAGCPAGWPRRPGRRGGRGRPDPGPAARRPARARPPPAGASSSLATAAGSSRGAWAAARLASAAACSCAPASRRLPSSWPRRTGRRGRRGRRDRGPAARRPARARPPPAGAQQLGHGARVVEGDVGGRIPGQQRGGLLVRARLPQAVQQLGHADRVVEGGVGGGSRASSAAACSCAPASRRLPSSMATAPGSSRATWAAGSRASSAAACSCAPASRRTASRSAMLRVVEGGVGGGPARGAGVCAQVGRGTSEVDDGAGVAGCGGVLVQLGSVPVQAAIVGGVTERGLVAGRGVRGGCGPELRRGDLAGAVRPAMLVQVVREPVQRPRGGSHAGGLVPAVAGGGRAGRGRMRVSGPRAPLHGTAV